MSIEFELLMSPINPLGYGSSPEGEVFPVDTERCSDGTYLMVAVEYETAVLQYYSAV